MLHFACTVLSAAGALPQTPAAGVPEIETRVRALTAELEPLGCAPTKPLGIDVLGPDEAAAQYLRDLELCYGPGWVESLRYLAESFGKPPGSDVGEFRARIAQPLLGERAAWFSIERRKLVVVSTRASVVGAQEARLIAEVAKAARDQALGLALVLSPEPRSTEAVNLRRTTIEGEAALAALAVIERRAGRDPSKLALPKAARIQPGNAAEELIQASGRDVALRRLRIGGWELVHAMVSTPPASTEQSLHPVKMPADQPRAISLPAWPESAGVAELVRDDVIGELGILALLIDAGVPEQEATLAAIGWDADRLQLLRSKDGELAVAWRIVFDRSEDVQQFAEVFGTRVLGRVIARGRSVDWVRSNSVEFSAALHAELSKNTPAAPINNGDAAGARIAEDAVRPDAGLRAKIVDGWWVNPRFELSLPAPRGWTPTLADGKPQLSGPVREGFRDYVIANLLEDVEGREVKAILEQHRAQVGGLPGSTIEVAEVRQVAGEDAIYMRYRVSSAADNFHVTSLAFPRRRIPVWISAVVADEAWTALAPTIDDMFARVRFDEQPPGQR